MKADDNIVLVGMMGAGKTTVGRLLARRLKRAFYDSDEEIERRCGVRIPVIFDIEGEPGFRARETHAWCAARLFANRTPHFLSRPASRRDPTPRRRFAASFSPATGLRPACPRRLKALSEAAIVRPRPPNLVAEPLGIESLIPCSIDDSMIQ